MNFDLKKGSSIISTFFIPLLLLAFPNLPSDYPGIFWYMVFLFALAFVMICFWNKINGNGEDDKLAVWFVLLVVIWSLFCIGYVLCWGDKARLASENHDVRIENIERAADGRIAIVGLKNAGKDSIAKPVKVNFAAMELGGDNPIKKVHWAKSIKDSEGIISGSSQNYNLSPHLDVPSKHSFLAMFIRSKELKGGISSYVWYTTTQGLEWHDRHKEAAKLDQGDRENKEQKQMDLFVGKVLNCFVERSFFPLFVENEDACFEGEEET